MPRYFFDVHNGLQERDDTGRECPGLEDARVQAIRMITAYAARPDLLAEDGAAIAVRVRDATGRQVLTTRLVFSVETG